MDIVIIVALTALILVLVALIIWLFVPRRRQSGINVVIDDRTRGVHVTRQDEGLRFEVVYDGAEPVDMDERPAEYGMEPGLVNDVAPAEEGLDREFWTRVSRIDDLSVEERARVVATLRDHGFISRADADGYLLPGEDGDDADPADRTAYDEAYPRKGADVELPEGEDFNDFSI